MYTQIQDGFVLDLTMYLADFTVWTDSQSSKCYAMFLEG